LSHHFAELNWERDSLLIFRRCSPEIRLQQVCQGVHVAQLAILDAEEVSIGRAAAAGWASGAGQLAN